MRSSPRPISLVHRQARAELGRVAASESGGPVSVRFEARGFTEWRTFEGNGAVAENGPSKMTTSGEDLRAALADAHAALEASQRATARAREETRVARRERDDATASAQRLREALKTFAQVGDEGGDGGNKGDDETDETQETHENVRGSADEALNSMMNTEVHEVAEAHTDSPARQPDSSTTECSILRAKLNASLEAAKTATRHLENAKARMIKLEMERDAALEKAESAEAKAELAVAKTQTAQTAAEVARTQLAETSERLRSTIAAEVSPVREKKESKTQEDLAVMDAMEATVSRLANALRTREEDLEHTQHTVATLVTERSALEMELRELRDLHRNESGHGRKENKINRNGSEVQSPAAAALSSARSLNSRRGGRALLDREGQVPRARAFTSTKR